MTEATDPGCRRRKRRRPRRRPPCQGRACRRVTLSVQQSILRDREGRAPASTRARAALLVVPPRRRGGARASWSDVGDDGVRAPTCATRGRRWRAAGARGRHHGGRRRGRRIGGGGGEKRGCIRGGARRRRTSRRYEPSPRGDVVQLPALIARSRCPFGFRAGRRRALLRRPCACCGAPRRLGRRRRRSGRSRDPQRADYDEDGGEAAAALLPDAAAFSYFALAGSLAPLEVAAAGDSADRRRRRTSRRSGASYTTCADTQRHMVARRRRRGRGGDEGGGGVRRARHQRREPSYHQLALDGRTRIARARRSRATSRSPLKFLWTNPAEGRRGLVRGGDRHFLRPGVPPSCCWPTARTRPSRTASATRRTTWPRTKSPATSGRRPEGQELERRRSTALVGNTTRSASGGRRRPSKDAEPAPAARRAAVATAAKCRRGPEGARGVVSRKSRPRWRQRNSPKKYIAHLGKSKKG